MTIEFPTVEIAEEQEVFEAKEEEDPLWLEGEFVFQLSMVKYLRHIPEGLP